MKKLSYLLYLLVASHTLFAQNAFDNAAISFNVLGGYSFAPNNIDQTHANNILNKYYEF